jgi:DNA repair protein RadD
MTTATTTVALRPYQDTAVDAVLGALEQGDHPVLSLPTGSGKSLVIAALAAQLDGRILVATHRQELLEQNAAQLERYDDEAQSGIYSAGLGRRDGQARVIFGGIQSIYRRMDTLQQAGPFRYIIVDEAHRVPPPSEDSMYGTVFDACPDALRIGLSATPYRLDDGLLHEGDDTWFTSMPVHIGIRELTPQYLAPLVGMLTAHDIDVSDVRTRAGEFITRELSQAASEEEAIQGALEELCPLAAARQHWLLFCVDVTHSRLVHAAIEARGITAELLLGETPQDERRGALDRFRAGVSRALVNCEVATTGFDIPDIDCIAMLRPTMSNGLCVQMLGRGTRQAQGKVDCLVLDFAGNIERHTPLDELAELRKSPALEAREAAEAADRLARARAAQHRTTASLADPMAPGKGTVTYGVHRVDYARVEAKKYPGRYMIRLGYLCPDRPGRRWVTQYLCLEHPGWAQTQARGWFERRGLPIPRTAADALPVLSQAHLPARIVVREDAEWPRVLIEQFDDQAAPAVMRPAMMGHRVTLGGRVPGGHQ